MGDPVSDLIVAVKDRYRVERELGAGGMATVYLADDVRHHRRVAIKVLRPELAAALGAERFLREIATTAGLRHPHIVPLYDSGEGQDLLYYVMPFVEGQSLRDRLQREKQLPLDDALRITAEVADALGYAHSRGVIHRDIKPENILLEGGHAVVADFGIAHAIDAAGVDRVTLTGVSLGTPTYMSPEQAAGERELDARSDVYALACVLHEMLAGQPPFTGPTIESVVRQHVIDPPPSVTRLRPSVPPATAAAIERALSKAPADRFQSASEFAAALRIDGPRGTTARTVPDAWRRWPVVVGALMVAALVGVTAVLRATRAPAPIRLGVRSAVTVDRGLELDPALSPDGKLVAYSAAGSVLTVRQVDGGAPVQVIRAAAPRGRWPAWLPDGQRLVFASHRGIEVVTALGGTPRLLVAGGDLDRGVTVAPDGRTFAYVSHDSLFAQPLEGGPPRLVTQGYEVHSPAWSPDGRWIAFVQGDVQYIRLADLGNLARTRIWLVPASGGKMQPVTDAQSLNMSPAWASDRSLLFISDRDGGRDVYQVALSGDGSLRAAPVRITTGLNPHAIGISRDGSRLVYSAFTETSNVWSLPVPASGSVSVASAVPETQGNQMIENLGVSNDGAWLGYNVERGGAIQVNRLHRGTKDSEVEAVTSDTAGSYWVSWSPDAKEVAFHRFRGERRVAFVSPVEGGVPIAITDGTDDERSPEWSPDGRHLLLLANWGTKPALHVFTRESNGRWSGPHALQIVLGSDTIAPGIADWSPDGRLIACGCGEGGIVVAPVNGGQGRRLASVFPTKGWAFPQWSADGRTVFHLSEDSEQVTAVVGVPVDGGPGRIVVRFDDPSRPWHRYGFRVRGGRMFFTLGERESDIWVSAIER